MWQAHVLPLKIRAQATGQVVVFFVTATDMSDSMVVQPSPGHSMDLDNDVSIAMGGRVGMMANIRIRLSVNCCPATSMAALVTVMMLVRWV